MAARRMFKINFILDDQFISMSSSAQVLYIRLLGLADDEGFANNIKIICKSRRTLQELIDNDLIIKFDSGIVLIKHWLYHNKVRKDMFKPTIFKKEKALVLLDSDDVYVEKSEIEPENLRNETVTQDSIVQDRQGQSNSVQERVPAPGATAQETVTSGEALSPKNNFEIFWSCYPYKCDRQKAERLFMTLNPPMDLVMQALEKQKRSVQWCTDNGAFIPKPTNWLKNRRWEDSLTVSQPSSNPSGQLGKEELAAIQRALQWENQ